MTRGLDNVGRAGIDVRLNLDKLTADVAKAEQIIADGAARARASATVAVSVTAAGAGAAAAGAAGAAGAGTAGGGLGGAAVAGAAGAAAAAGARKFGGLAARIKEVNKTLAATSGQAFVLLGRLTAIVAVATTFFVLGNRIYARWAGINKLLKETESGLDSVADKLAAMERRTEEFQRKLIAREGTFGPITPLITMLVGDGDDMEQAEKRLQELRTIFAREIREARALEKALRADTKDELARLVQAHIAQYGALTKEAAKQVGEQLDTLRRKAAETRDALVGDFRPNAHTMPEGFAQKYANRPPQGRP